MQRTPPHLANIILDVERRRKPRALVHIFVYKSSLTDFVQLII